MFVIRPCHENDIDAVDHFFSNIVFDEEPLIAANGPHQIAPANKGLSSAVIPQGYSVLAQDQDGNIIGASLNDGPPQSFPYIYTNSSDDLKFQKLFQYMEDESDVMNKAPGAIEVRLIAVCKEWRKKGVCSSLLRATEATARSAGISWLKIYCTSFYTSCMVSKFSWTHLYSISYADYVKECPEIRLPAEPHTHCKLYIKKIL